MTSKLGIGGASADLHNHFNGQPGLRGGLYVLLHRSGDFSALQICMLGAVMRVGASRGPLLGLP
jgi:hypothetical protein